MRRIAVTPAIAARMRAGEQVSPEEIAAAQAAMTADAAGAMPRKDQKETTSDAAENEWLPEGLKKASKGDTKVRKGKKRR